jgi:hypothetical protein
VFERSELSSLWIAGELCGSSEGDGRPECSLDVDPGLEALCGELDVGA